MKLIRSVKVKPLSVIIFLVFAVFLLAMQVNERSFQDFCDGASSLDMRFHYSSSDVYQLFDALGVPGRLIYTRILLIDFAFIASFALVQNMIIKSIMGKELLKTGFRRLTALSYLRGFADVIENIILLILLNNFPSSLPQLVTFSSAITALKFIFLALWLTAIPLIIIYRIKLKRKAKQQ
jgi:hypothetical protein